ncbi:MAG: hypothetical protein QOE12_3121, partial [Mycobacterium sp.]|nr:hypothetical protein [Mycobacterium sp.]
TTFELDDVIDPAETRAWIIRLLFKDAAVQNEGNRL